MTAPDPIGDIRTLPGAEFVTACIDVVETEARAIHARERRYVDRQQASDPDAIRKAALLSAAAAMLDQIKADGAAMTTGRKNYTVVNAVTAGKSAFLAAEKLKP